jgi:serine/threonine kinase PknH
VPPPVSVPPGVPPFGPTTGPTTMPGRGADDRSRQWMLPTVIIGVVAALLLGVMGVMVGLLVSKNSGQTAGPAETTSYGASTPGYPIPGTTIYQTVTPSSRQPVPSSSTATPTQDPESASLAQLQQLAGGDRAYVTTQLADRWVPQLSSKRPGVVDDGVVWNNSLTLQEHLRLRQRYNAKLLWSGDWSVFDAPNFWVTIVPIPFGNADDALRWCSGQGFDADHCYAKLVSTTHPVAGSTAHN